jgi:hypothetical protein
MGNKGCVKKRKTMVTTRTELLENGNAMESGYFLKELTYT